MKAKILFGFLLGGVLNSAMAQDVFKDQVVVWAFQGAKSVCSEASPFHKCLRISKRKCLEKLNAAKKRCIEKYQSRIPNRLHPSEQTVWSLKLTFCAGILLKDKTTFDVGCLRKVAGKGNQKRCPKVEPNTMPDQSMAPFLNEGERYEVIPLKKLGRPLRKGDVVVFKTRYLTLYVRRIIAAPGDQLEVNHAGGIVINGQAGLRNMLPTDACRSMIAKTYGKDFVGDRPYKCYFELTGGDKHLVWLTPDGLVPYDEKKVIPPKHYYVLGDNRFSKRGEKYTTSFDGPLLHIDEIVGIAKPAKKK